MIKAVILDMGDLRAMYSKAKKPFCPEKFRGYTKEKPLINIKHIPGFDTSAIIFYND